MSQLISIYSIELVKGIKFFPISNRSLIDISYMYSDHNEPEFGIGLQLSCSTPIHIGISIWKLAIYIQFLSVAN